MVEARVDDGQLGGTYNPTAGATLATHQLHCLPTGTFRVWSVHLNSNHDYYSTRHTYPAKICRESRQSNQKASFGSTRHLVIVSPSSPERHERKRPKLQPQNSRHSSADSCCTAVGTTPRMPARPEGKIEPAAPLPASFPDEGQPSTLHRAHRNL